METAPDDIVEAPDWIVTEPDTPESWTAVCTVACADAVSWTAPAEALPSAFAPAIRLIDPALPPFPAVISMEPAEFLLEPVARTTLPD
jgi:hypothetical protein